MLDRVVDEIGECLLEGGAVGDEFHGMRGGIGSLVLERNAPVGGEELELAGGVADQPGEVDGRKLVAMASRVGAGEAEDVLDERPEPAGFLDDETRVFASLGFLVNASVCESLGEQAQAGERGPELVGHRGDEVGLLLVDGELLGKGAMRLPRSESGHARGEQNHATKPELLPALRRAPTPAARRTKLPR